LARRPRLVVACRFGAAAGGERRAGRPERTRRTGHVWTVWLLPRAWLVAFLCRWRVDCVVEPAMPGRRHTGGLRITVIGDPAPLEAERLVDLAADGPIVAIAELILADRFAVHPGPELGTERLRIPPGEQLEQEIFHRGRALKTFILRAFCHFAADESSDGDPEVPHQLSAPLSMIVDRMDSIRTLVIDIKDWLDWLPDPVVATIILGLAAIAALALHKWASQFARRLLAYRYPNTFSIFNQTRGPTRLALLTLAMIVVIPVAPLKPEAAQLLARLLAMAI